MMRRLAAFLVLLLIACAWHRPAQASADDTCYPTWILDHADYSGCDNMAILQPGNDTRVNLLLLMLDLRGDKLAQPATASAASPTPDPLVDWPTFGAQFVPPPPQANSDQSGDQSGADQSGDSFPEGEGSRCLSNNAGTQAFVAALDGVSGLSDSEKATLTAARQGLAPDCTKPSGGADAVAKAVQQMQSAAGKSFAAYLQGAEAFYDGDFDAAASAFKTLSSDPQPWLAETARYMQGRVELNRAQVGLFDEYGNMQQGKTADAQVIDAAEADFKAYLAAYPKGQYAGSARGLLRRVYWLGGRTDKLAASYDALLPADAASRGGIDDVVFADELDNKLLNYTQSNDGLSFDAIKSLAANPTLLAVADLAQMRCAPQPDNSNQSDGTASSQPAQNQCLVPFKRDVLEAQKASFAADPALYDYLLALYDFTYGKNPGVVLQAIPENTKQATFSSLEFSRQMLRGMALEAQKDPGTGDHWLAMLPGATLPLQRGAVELAIAMHDERSHALDQVFAADSPVQNTEIRVILLSSVADAKLLRRQAGDGKVTDRERQNAIYTLLYKEVTRGFYADFVKDLALVPAKAPTDWTYDQTTGASTPPTGVFTQTASLGDYDCGPLKDTATRLAHNAHATKALLCLADFMRANGFDGYGDENLDDHSAQDQPNPDELGSTPSLFPGKNYARLEVYKTLIASPQTPAADRAYALFRAVNCYGPSGINSCGGVEVPQEQRKAWFLRLKHDYPNSKWAKEQQYYW